jgi:hypothetical protein
MEFSGQVGTYIAEGGPPARPKGGMPLSTTSCPLVGRDALVGTSSQIRYLRRDPRGTSRPLGGRDVPGPTRPARSAGGRLPFLKIFPTGTPFSNFNFFNPFLKKAPGCGVWLSGGPFLYQVYPEFPIQTFDTSPRNLFLFSLDIIFGSKFHGHKRTF